MNIVDLTLLVSLGGFALYGFWFGFIHMVGSVVGVVFGAIAAGRLYGSTAHWFGDLSTTNPNLANVLGFIVTFILVNRLVGLLFWVIEKIYKFIAIIPFMKLFDRLLGAGLGFIEGTFVIGLCVYFASRFPWSLPFSADLAASPIAAKFYAVGSLLAPLLPAAVRAASSVI